MPDDSTPHGGEALHPLPDRARIPRDPTRGNDTPRPDAQADRRPALPQRSEPMAADIEDEDADPVVDSGPGIAQPDTGKPSVTRQPAD